MFVLIWSVVIFAALYLYFRQVYTRFSRHGVKTDRLIPPLGSMTRTLLRLENFIDFTKRIYADFPGEKFIGVFEFVTPIVVIRDTELIKNIAIKDFEYFIDHRFRIDEEVDPFFGRNLMALQGQEWRDMRSTLSPAFTSSKIRLMVPFMVEVGDQMIQSLKQEIKASGSDYIDVDCKDLARRYANDVIASCAFGLKVDSHTEKENEFYRMGKSATNFKFTQIIKMFAFVSFPSVMKKLKMSLFNMELKKFFKELVLNTMKDREDRHIIRPDMIHLLMEAKKGKLTHDDKAAGDEHVGFATVEESSVGKKQINRAWSNDDLIAQATLFFIAGFESVATAMAFLLHELALNPDVEEKLVEEIKENQEKNGGKFDYNSIQNMTYLDMVISEILRLWPVAIGLDRICIQDYNLGKPNSKATEDFIVRKGEGISIPVFGIHRNPDYFPNPDKFDPERFSEENKHKILPFTYMPFGVGPRNCIASRFALCELKVMVYQLLQHMEVSPSEKTCIPTQLAKDFTFRIKGGHWIRLKPRV